MGQSTRTKQETLIVPKNGSVTSSSHPILSLPCPPKLILFVLYIINLWTAWGAKNVTSSYTFSVLKCICITSPEVPFFSFMYSYQCKKLKLYKGITQTLDPKPQTKLNKKKQTLKQTGKKKNTKTNQQKNQQQKTKPTKQLPSNQAQHS